MSESQTPVEPQTDWSHRLKVWGGITVAVLLALLIGAAFIPRWWAQRVGDQANESFTGGIMLGLFYGFIFTLLPVLLIIWGIRRRRSGRMWLWILVGAMLLALPNLLTLGITLGPGSGAHAGDRTLDVEARAFAARRWAVRFWPWLRSASSGTCVLSAPGAPRTSRARHPAAIGGQACLDVPSHSRPSGSPRLSGRGRGRPLQTAIHDLIHFVWEVVPHWLDWSEPAWWYVILVPAFAGGLVALFLRLPGHGGHSPLEGVSTAPIAPTELPSIRLAGLATLGLGLVLGPEAPLIALGLGMGVIAVRLVRMEGTEAQLLVLAGAFAAIAALFGGPLAASVMLLELVAMSGAIPAATMVRALAGISSPPRRERSSSPVSTAGKGCTRLRCRCRDCPPTTASGWPTSRGASSCPSSSRCWWWASGTSRTAWPEAPRGYPSSLSS